MLSLNCLSTERKKGKQEQYSRSARETRKRNILARADENQTQMTDFVFMRQELSNMQNRDDVKEAVLSSLPEDLRDCFTHFLDVLIKHAIKNHGRFKEGRRYDSKLKLFAAYLYLYGGRSLYEILSTNLKLGLPSLKTVNRTVRAEMDYKEDDLRIEELLLYLDLKKYPRNVCIEEDQTRVKGRIEYWSKTNQLVGFVLPISANGVPEKNCFLATSASTIKNVFLKNTMSSYINVVVAQPMQDGAYPFCIASYGTINKFDANEVNSRWDHISNRCRSYGITVDGYSGDADSKILRTMNVRTFIDIRNLDLKWFFVNMNN